MSRRPSLAPQQQHGKYQPQRPQHAEQKHRSVVVARTVGQPTGSQWYNRHAEILDHGDQTVSRAEAPLPNVDLSDHSLMAIMVEEEILYEDPPGNQGETEYHWVMLDVETADGDIGLITAGTPAVFNTTLIKPSAVFPIDDPAVIVLVQNNFTKEIRQGGSTLYSPFTSVDQLPATGLLGWLGPVHPNPFNPRTTIDFAVTRTQQVHIAVHDLSGRCVTTLTDRQYDAGQHQVEWAGCDDSNRSVASGTYLVRMTSAAGSEARKITLAT